MTIIHLIRKPVIRAAFVTLLSIAAILVAGTAGYMLARRNTNCALRIAQPTAEEIKYATDYVKRVGGRQTSSGDAKLVVPSPEVAIAIHNAVCGAIFGESEMAHEQPFTAIRCGEFWVVAGYLPPNMLGGVPITVIRARNGEVIDIEAQE